MTPDSSSPPTILESFQNKIYVLELDDKVTVKTVKASGATTKNTPPPEMLFYTPIVEHETTADEFLNQPMLNQILGSRTISAKRPEIKQDNEAGVVLATMTYVLDPITEVLHAMFPGKWTLHSEQTQVEKNAQKNAQKDEQKDAEKDTEKDAEKEKVGESALRTDLIFKTSGSKETIAVVEFKRRQYIRYKDFEDAIVTTNPTLEDRKKKQADLTWKGTGTLLTGNAEPYCRQVRAYAIRTECKHVALFNWDHLLLFDFDPVKPKMNGKPASASARPKVSWVQESDEATGFMESGLIRKVLLGWLIKAFKDAGIESESRE
ncbi:uncharacterized protein J4E88_007931 [Alternaria novae-zelandiae]|uniref:uncharacterized protein n=1 Tax=Alternaria novae-zelandiae TaxID=430562 RepID=UPI0020C354B2|nr:uncharacterized protein J4E88_007931 [Alternaria novae-zelandiae]KAI4675027.1 hypothetical protein J4E88_007931 [Alternaria novae-zelandiae]